ncbi:YxiJ-like family protein [Fredinandcohnia quinoae]|uniref:YxiJ-like family protein n=1 Tax=Fredinandcohnia quinoae TaxID=2918902 RepID=A0AAW5DY33_9BACI|nr:YxiJ-like family protein [Fredinandcohnia sp. SECRCQ15]MCH1625268.1 YxiJ-like family protein [Fredinandcohnia sp. SECRCQ15]
MNQLVDISKKLYEPFPYKDTRKIQEDFIKEFQAIPDEDNCLNGDLNTYFANIAGTLGYVLKGKSTSIPKGQIDMLHYTFFEYFDQYTFLAGKISQYQDFSREMIHYEQARTLLLEYLSDQND